MTITATTNLSLPLITTGTESGTWGDVVDNGLTSYLDIAIAGGLAITITTTDVTLSNTAGTASATNLGSTSAQYAILNISGAKTAARNLILPGVSKFYLINNSAATGGYLLTVKASGTNGVTLVDGEKAIVAWNGSDYVKVGGYDGNFTAYSVIANGGYSTLGGFNAGTTGASPSGIGISFSTNISNGSAEGDIWNGADPATYTNTGILFTQRLTASTRRDLMFLHNSGNVGIGTNSPTAKLSAVKSGGDMFDLYDSSTGLGYRVNFNNASSPRQVNFQINPDGTGYTTRMTLDGSGNVGIGTSSPSTYGKFVVLNSAATSTTQYANSNILAISNASNADSNISISNGVDHSAKIGIYNGANLYFALDGSERMRIGASGQIGIGGANYGTSGQVLTSQGTNSPPVWGSAGLGAGQSWTNMLSPTVSRVFGTTYTNSTGRSIMVAVSSTSGQFTQLFCYIDTVLVQTSSGSWQAGSSASQSTISIIIPNGSTYYFTQSIITAGSGSALWFELR